MSPSTELARRVTVAAVGIPVALVLIVHGGWPLTLVLAGIAGGVAWELFRLAGRSGIRPFGILGTTCAAGLVLLAGGTGRYEAAAPWSLGIFLALFLLSAALAVTRRWPEGQPVSAVAVTLLGALYGGGCLSFALFLRHFPAFGGMSGGEARFLGSMLLVFPIAVTWVGDTAAYFGGRRLGRHKLIPSASPGKTVEGSVASLVASFAVGGGLGWWIPAFHPDPATAGLLGGGMGLLLSAAAQVGDLAESVLKREAGVKDSGTILPGHGGMLDRFDALLFTLPLTYGLLRVMELIR